MSAKGKSAASIQFRNPAYKSTPLRPVVRVSMLCFEIGYDNILSKFLHRIYHHNGEDTVLLDMWTLSLVRNSKELENNVSDLFPFSGWRDRDSYSVGSFRKT
jgi:hypothetical protein